jgi:hypothetical protein
MTSGHRPTTKLFFYFFPLKKPTKLLKKIHILFERSPHYPIVFVVRKGQRRGLSKSIKLNAPIHTGHH